MRSYTPRPTADEWAKTCNELVAMKEVLGNWKRDVSSPSYAAVANGKAVVDVARELDIYPDQIVVDCDGGVEVSFHDGWRFVLIACHNDGDIWSKYYDRKGNVDARFLGSVDGSDFKDKLAARFRRLTEK